MRKELQDRFKEEAFYIQIKKQVKIIIQKLKILDNGYKRLQEEQQVYRTDRSTDGWTKHL